MGAHFIARFPVRAAVVLGLAALSASCGGSSSAALPDSVRPGYELARSAGCFACHGEGGVGSIGPAWTGLAGSEVLLSDGRTVVADREYLVRAIADPGAEKVAGASLVMPTVGLDADQIESIVDYIEHLSSNG